MCVCVCVCVCVCLLVCGDLNTSAIHQLTTITLYSCSDREDAATKRDHQEELHPRGSGCNVSISFGVTHYVIILVFSSN